jgi:hypothetical protein
MIGIRVAIHNLRRQERLLGMNGSPPGERYLHGLRVAILIVCSAGTDPDRTVLQDIRRAAGP